MPLATVCAQYETLRGAALGEPLLPEARCGLALLLRRGMSAWARALNDSNVSREREPVNPGEHPALPEQRAVVQLFAALAMMSS